MPSSAADWSNCDCAWRTVEKVSSRLAGTSVKSLPFGGRAGSPSETRDW